MERKKLQFASEEWKRLGERAKTHSILDGGLAEQLWKMGDNLYSRDVYNDTWNKLKKIYGKAPNELKTLDEFWSPKLKKAVKYLIGKDGLTDLMEMSEIHLTGQFSQSMWRRSYRSKEVGYHAASLIPSVIA